MPRQNRVTPFGNLVAIEARGTLMGNRGILHDDQQQIIKRWTHINWVTCTLDYNERKRDVMSPGKYTELFFLDEATALAAGHRPCGRCRKEAFKRFTQLFRTANQARLPEFRDDIDRLLHFDRLAGYGRWKHWRTYLAPLNRLPDGVFVACDEQPKLLWNGMLHTWTPAGYREAVAVNAWQEVEVLTPLATTSTLACGYRPQVHCTLSIRQNA